MEHIDPEQRAWQVSELLDRGRIALARNGLREGFASDPENVELMFQAARADVLEGQHDSALETLGRVLVKEPAHLSARLLMLWLLTDRGQLVEAEELALDLLREQPGSPDLYAAYARVMLRALKITKATDLCKEALRLAPDNESALSTMALCDLIERPGATDGEALQKLLRQHPHDQHVLALVVFALSQAGRSREALRGAQQLLRMQPNDPQWLANVKQLRFVTHWSMLPLWPLYRYGWGASIAIWVVGIGAVNVLGRGSPGLAGGLSTAIVVYAVYSWVWPPILRRLLGVKP